MPRLTASLLAITALSLPVPAIADSLDTMLHKLVQAHPRISAAEQDRQSTEAAKQEAFSGYLPTVDVNASTGYENVDRTDLLPAGAKTDENASSYSASITQNIFKGFRDRAAVKAADISAGMAGMALDATRQQILLEGASAYMEVLRFMELTQLALDNQATLRDQLHLEDERVKRGSGIAVDALQAKSRLQVSKERYTAFMGGLKDAISRYTQVFNQAPQLDTLQLPPLPIDRLPTTLEAAADTAVAHNPQLASTKQNVTLAETARETAKGGYFPSVNVVGATSYDDNMSGILGEEYNHSLKVQTSWQLFSGFADRSRARQADFGYQSAIETAHYTERKTVEEVKLAWSSLVTSKERTDLLDNAVNIAGEVYDARKRLRDAGSETALNVLDAENELYRARIDAASARYDYYLSVYRLLFAMGELSVDTATP